jgi:hypothetical protein
MSNKPKRIINVTVQAPKEIPEEARATAQAKAHEAAVLALWELGKISASRAAQELDLGIHDFLDLLTARGLPVVRGELNLEAIEKASQKLASKHP